MFFKDDMCFFKKTCQKKYMFFMVDKTKQIFCSKIVNAFFRRKRKGQKLIFAEDTYLGPL